jgi:hypothetical protein
MESRCGWNSFSGAFFEACRNGAINLIQEALHNDRKEKKYARHVSLLKITHPESGLTALMVASRHGQLEAVRTILKEGVDMNFTRRRFCDCALHFAALHGHIDVVKLLIEHGANKYVKNSIGNYPIDIAIGNGKKNCVLALSDPPQPPKSLIQRNSYSTSVQVKWDPCPEKYLQILEYGIKIENITGENVQHTEQPRRNTSVSLEDCQRIVENIFQPSCLIKTLEPGNVYAIYVRGKSEIGWGPYSESLTAKTKRSVPGVIKDFKATNINGTSIKFEWVCPQLNGSPVDKIEIQYWVVIRCPETCSIAKRTPGEIKAGDQQAQILQLQKQIETLRGRWTQQLKLLRPLELQLEDAKKSLKDKRDKLFSLMNTKGKKTEELNILLGTGLKQFKTEIAFRAYEQLRAKEKDIASAKKSIYHKNGMLIGSWVAEEELRHSYHEVQKMRRELEAYCKTRFNNTIKGVNESLFALNKQIGHEQNILDHESYLLEKRLERLQRKRKEFSLNYENAISDKFDEIKKAQISASENFTIFANDLKLNIENGKMFAIIERLSPTTLYCFKIHAKNDEGWGEFGNVVKIETGFAPYCSSCTPTSISLRWNCSKSCDHMVVLMQDKISFLSRPKKWFPLGQCKKLPFVATDLSPMSVYRFAVIPEEIFRLLDIYPTTPVIATETLEKSISVWYNLPPDVPKTVKNLRVLGEGTTSVELEWSHSEGHNVESNIVKCFLVEMHTEKNYRGVIITKKENVVCTQTLSTVPASEKEWKLIARLHPSEDCSISTRRKPQNCDNEVVVTYCYSVQNLDPNRLYNFQVAACNDHGISRYISIPHPVQTLLAKPSSFPPCVVSKSATSIALQWNPAEGYGEQIISYQLQINNGKLDQILTSYSNVRNHSGICPNINDVDTACLAPCNDKIWKTLPCVYHDTHTTVTSLFPGEKYVFRVRASNSLGYGSYSEESAPTETIVPKPIVLRVFLVETENGRITIGWELPLTNVTCPDKFEVQQQKKTSTQEWDISKTVAVQDDMGPLHYTCIDKLSAGVYKFRVRAHKNGWGIFCPESAWVAVEDCQNRPS